MNGLIRFTWGALLFGLFICPANAAFNSFYIFGDTVSSTTHNTSPYPSATNYFGQRFSNGRVWVEVLAQQLNLTNNYWYSTNATNQVSYDNLTASSTNWSYSSNNLSYFYHTSADLVAELNTFVAPVDASNALLVVWVDDADMVDATLNDGTDISEWSNSIHSSLTNHWRVIANLYAKGIRTLIMPDAVDISKVPAYQNYAAAQNGFLRQMVTNYNNGFSSVLSNAMDSFPGLTIYRPDFFTLLDNILTNAPAYGLTNAGTYALNQNNIPNRLTDLSMTGPGTNYIWWDNQDPTARVNAIMAILAKQLIEPVRFSKVTSVGGGNRLDLVNVPVGLYGNVLGSTNLALTDWTALTNFPGTNGTESVFVPASGPMQFYRLSFPFTWTWP